MVSAFDVQWQFTTFPVILGFLLGCTWIVSENESGSEEVSEEPVSAWTIRPQVLINQGVCALFLILQMLNFWGSEAEYYHSVSKVAMLQHRAKEAALLSMSAIALNPWQGEYYHQLGLVYLSHLDTLTKDEKERLVKSARKGCQLDSHRAVHWDLLAKTLAQEKKYEEATHAAHQSLTMDSINYPSFYETVALLRNAQGDIEGGRLILQGAIQRFPISILDEVFDFRAESLRKQLADLYCQLGQNYQPLKNPAIAEPLFRSSIKLDGNNFYSQLGLGDSLYQQSKFKEAIPYLEAARNKEPEISLIHGLLWDCYKHEGKSKEADTAAKKYAALHAQGK